MEIVKLSIPKTLLLFLLKTNYVFMEILDFRK